MIPGRKKPIKFEAKGFLYRKTDVGGDILTCDQKSMNKMVCMTDEKYAEDCQ